MIPVKFPYKILIIIISEDIELERPPLFKIGRRKIAPHWLGNFPLSRGIFAEISLSRGISGGWSDITDINLIKTVKLAS